MGCVQTKTAEDDDDEIRVVIRSIEIEDTEGSLAAQRYVREEMANFTTASPKKPPNVNGSLLLILRALDLGNPEDQRSKEHFRESLARYTRKRKMRYISSEKAD